MFALIVCQGYTLYILTKLINYMNRTHSLKNSTYRGFTLIELLVVIAIIGLLSTIIAAPIQNARKKARDSKKIAEMKAIQLALDQYAEANQAQYPYGLNVLSPIYMPILPAFASTSNNGVADRDKFAYTPYSSSGVGLLANNRFAYHLGVHLENFSQGLDNDSDCFSAERNNTFQVLAGTTTCAYFSNATADIHSYYEASSTDPSIDNWRNGMPQQSPMAGAGVSAPFQDFDGSDGDTSRCDGIMDCIFDVTGQQ